MTTMGQRIKQARLAMTPRMTQAMLADCVGVSRPAVTQWETGNSKSLEGENLIKVANCLKVRPQWIITGKGPMRDAPQGVNEEQPSYTSNMELVPYGCQDVPFADNWVQAGEWLESGEVMNVNELKEEKRFPCPYPHGPRTVAVRVRGISMEPVFLDKEIIYIDPDSLPEDGNYVVVRLDSSGELTFKRLVIEGGRRYLKAENPNWPGPIIEIKEDSTIVGVVIGKYVRFK